MKDRLRFEVSVGLLLLAFFLTHYHSTGEVRTAAAPLEDLPGTIGAWQVKESESLDPKILEILQVSDYLMRSYTDPEGNRLSLFIGLWASQKKGAQIHSPLNCLPGGGWTPTDRSLVQIALPEPAGKISVNRLQVEKDGNRQLVFYWYQYQQKTIAGEIRARLQMIENGLFQNRTDALMVRIMTPMNGGPAGLNPGVLDFIREIHGQITETLYPAGEEAP